MPSDVVFVTGGTGTIGAPLVEALATDGARVVTMVRRPSAAAAQVEQVLGDLEQPDLGLDPAVAGRLRAEVTTIVHAGALTRFDAPLDEARRVNVEGTRRVLAFAERCPRVRRISMLSTLYVAGRRTGRISEADLDHGHGFVNAYEQSKHEAERLVREAMPRLPIAVCRLSTAIGDSRTGAQGRPAAIHHALRFLYHGLLPMMPGTPESPVDLIATDYAVHGVRHFAGPGFVPGRTFHLCAGDAAPAQAALVDLVVQAFLRHRPAWRRRAIEPPAIVPLETFELFRRSVDAVADSALRASVGVLAPFAPQLAYPKTFDDQGARLSLAAAGIERPALDATVSAVAKHLIEQVWPAERVARAAV